MEVTISMRWGHFAYIRPRNYPIQGPKIENAQAPIQNRIHISSDEDKEYRNVMDSPLLSVETGWLSHGSVVAHT